MLSKDKRLNLKKDFKWVAAGQKLGNSLIQLYIRQGENLEPKVGIALSKSAFRKATERNRARRLVSAAFEKLHNQILGGTNIVALPRPGVLELTSDEVAKVLLKLLQKGGMVKGEKNNSVST